IEAPCQEVFNALMDVERRMQLSPIWGLSQLLDVSANFPKPGSSYRVRVLTDAPFGIAGPARQSVHGAFEGLAHILSLKMGHDALAADPPSGTVTDPEPPAGEAVERKNVVATEQEYLVSECEAPHKFSYYLNADCRTIVTWKLQSIPRGTRLSYEEVFCDENTGEEEFLPTVRHVVHEWLANIKRYMELRGSRGRLFVKRLLDRFYLKLRPDQRRTVLLILFMQGLAMVTFVIAAIGLGIAGALF
ncbi:MAG: hypothetical protein WCC12_20465, partial [Anaerolineales bacterium]